MPIINYGKAAETSEKRLFDNPNISTRNKEILKQFLAAYDVSPARKVIFCNQIKHLLTALPDIRIDMYDREKVNKLFAQLRKDLSQNYLATIINVSLCFVRWINDHQTPKGFRDIKNISKTSQKRDLNSKDMITWQDGLNLAAATTSMQLKAMILTQLDAGMRPSEFVDCNYGWVSVDRDIVVITIPKNVTKTGSHREVILHRSVPYFLRWYEAHPTKKPDDPLWVVENNAKGHGNKRKKPLPKTDKVNLAKRSKYPTILKRITKLAVKINLKKPVDFYNFRHSSCVLDKIDNLPLELGADRHGHSVEYFINTYGRLDLKDLTDRYRKHYGGQVDTRQLSKNVVCNICQFVNKPEDNHCYKCHAPLSIKAAINDKTEIDRIRGEIETQKVQIKALYEMNKGHKKQ